MTPAEYRELRRLFEGALTAGRGQRERWLDERAPRGHPLRAALDTLLEHHVDDGFLADSAIARPALDALEERAEEALSLIHI